MIDNKITKTRSIFLTILSRCAMRCFNITTALKVKWKLVFTLLAAIVSVAAGLDSINNANEIVKAWFYKEELVVIEARLDPSPIRGDISDELGDVFLTLDIRNYNMSPIMIVSTNIEGRGSPLISKGKSGRQGPCTLSSEANENKPITIYPGKTASIMIGESIHLSGLGDIMSKINLQEIHPFPPEAGIGIHEVYFVDVLNGFLKDRYGEDTEIIAYIYTGAEKRKHSFSFKISQGKDLFSKDGSLQHDWIFGKMDSVKK